MNIYIAHTISGLTANEVFEYFDETAAILRDIGYTVYSPMYGKEEFRNNVAEKAIPFKQEGYKDNPVITNHAIFERDKWMVSQSDVLFLDLTGTENVSIGCMFELAWASYLGKHTIVVLEEENIHCHAFVLEAADIIWPTYEKAIEYLEKLVKKENR